MFISKKKNNNAVRVFCDDGICSRVFRKKVAQATLDALFFLHKKNSYCDVYLLSDSSIKKINLKFRKKEKPTNILSFVNTQNTPHPEIGGQIRSFLGEIYIAPEYIKTKGEDLIFILIHGILHLVGYTHSKKRDRIKMETLEVRTKTFLSKKK